MIRALGQEDDLARGAVRFSFGRFNTAEDLDRVIAILPEAIENLRKLSPKRRVQEKAGA